MTESAGRSCIAYVLRPDGTMVTPSRWRDALLRPLRHVHFAVAALLAMMLPFFFSACAARRTEGAGNPEGQAVAHGSEADHGNCVTLGVPLPPEASGSSRSTNR